MSIEAEINAMRKQTLRFIAADPISLVLHRVAKVKDGAGGFVLSDGPIDTQTFRLIPQQDLVAESINSDGVKEDPVYIILAAHDADIQEGDTFSWNTVEYLVRTIHRRTASYETKGDVVLRG